MINAQQIKAIDNVVSYLNGYSRNYVVTWHEIEEMGNDVYVKIHTKNLKFETDVLNHLYTFFVGPKGRIFRYVTSKKGNPYKKYMYAFEVHWDCEVY